jgi:NAD(P)-dependent dehydrogenase (short-subunit alcohol dehydrogenase family)
LQQRVNALLANREVRSTLAALEAAGSQVRYLAVDVADSSALNQQLTAVREQWGPIQGLIHAAGVLADKRIAEKSDSAFAHVFGTKVLGLQALLEATANDPLKLLAVFSSVSARCGNTGQADYAMANEVIAKVARSQARRRPGLRVKSFGWGPWEGGMVNPALKQKFAELGVPMIPLEQGAAMFVSELMDNRVDGVELVLGGEPRPEALLSAGAEARTAALEVSVNHESHDYLAGHAVDGAPVLPAVLVAEWFARVANGLRPGLSLQAITHLKVLKGVQLDRFSNGGQRFTIEAINQANSRGLVWSVSLLDQYRKPRYQATLELGIQVPNSEERAPKLELETWNGAEVYDQLLFHRGAFELIDTLHGVSDDGAKATLRGVNDAGWTGESWSLDVAALDAGLQMAVVMGQRLLGAPNMPMAVDALRSFTREPIQGKVHATAIRRKHGASELLTDIVLTDSEGRRCAELLGVRNIALPRATWSAA